MKTPLKLLVFIFSLNFFASAHAVGPLIIDPISADELNKVKALLDVPEERINFAKTKLQIDKMIDPTVNIHHELQQMNKIIAPISKLGLSTSMEKKNALRKYLYQAGD